jgi:hypothetical protein
MIRYMTSLLVLQLVGCVVDTADASNDSDTDSYAPILVSADGGAHDDADVPIENFGNECSNYIQCAVPAGLCHTATCINGWCGVSNSPNDSPCFAPPGGSGTCLDGECIIKQWTCGNGGPSCKIWSDCPSITPTPSGCVAPACVDNCCINACP